MQLQRRLPWPDLGLSPLSRLGAFALCLMLLNLSLAWVHTRNADLVAIMTLCWGIAVYSIWQHRQSIPLRHEPYSTVAGAVLVAWALYKGWVMADYDAFIRIQPFLLCLGLGLWASSARHVMVYRQGLVVLLVLALPEGILAQGVDQVINISEIAAQSTTAMLWYLGFEVTREGVFVLLPTGGIEVYRGCSGLKAMVELLRLALIFLVMVPTTLWEKLLVPVVALSLAYGVNVIRLVVMTPLAAAQQEAFHYWHEGSGSNLFPVISMGLFACFCMVLLQRKSATQPTRQRQATAPWPKWRWASLVPLWVGTIAVMLTAMAKLLILDQQPFAFPRQVPLSTAQLLQSRSSPGYEKNAYSEILAQHHYQYQYQDQQLQIDISYVTGTLGDLGFFAENYPVQGHQLQSLPQLEIRQQGSNFYALFTHENRAYLSACFDPKGQTTVEEGQFIQNWNSHWYLLGQDYIDDRCLWTHMSLPLNRQSPEVAFSILEENWVSWQQWWRHRIPRLST